MNTRGFISITVVILISILALGMAGVAWYYEANKDDTVIEKINTGNYVVVSSYDECAEAGYSVTGTNPQICQTPYGPTWVNNFNVATNVNTSTNTYTQVLTNVNRNTTEEWNTYKSSKFGLSIQIPPGFELLEYIANYNSINIAFSKFESYPIGSDNAIFKLTHKGEKEDYDKSKATLRDKYNAQIETIQIDGKNYEKFIYEDTGAYEGDSAGKIVTIFLENAKIQITERAGNQDYTFDVLSMGNQIVSSIKFHEWQMYSNGDIGFLFKRPSNYRITERIEGENKKLIVGSSPESQVEDFTFIIYNTDDTSDIPGGILKTSGNKSVVISAIDSAVEQEMLTTFQFLPDTSGLRTFTDSLNRYSFQYPSQAIITEEYGITYVKWENASFNIGISDKEFDPNQYGVFKYLETLNIENRNWHLIEAGDGICSWNESVTNFNSSSLFFRAGQCMDQQGNLLENIINTDANERNQILSTFQFSK